ncbi:hypothetical protein HDU82_000276 [Entophlyctis luteolus]|nr:hypothetical protein HDU82_000276 [Entophlyctis luteolus]
MQNIGNSDVASHLNLWFAQGSHHARGHHVSEAQQGNVVGANGVGAGGQAQGMAGSQLSQSQAQTHYPGQYTHPQQSQLQHQQQQHQQQQQQFHLHHVQQQQQQQQQYQAPPQQNSQQPTQPDYYPTNANMAAAAAVLSQIPAMDPRQLAAAAAAQYYNTQPRTQHLQPQQPTHQQQQQFSGMHYGADAMYAAAGLSAASESVSNAQAMQVLQQQPQKQPVVGMPLSQTEDAANIAPVSGASGKVKKAAGGATRKKATASKRTDPYGAPAGEAEADMNAPSAAAGGPGGNDVPGKSYRTHRRKKEDDGDADEIEQYWPDPAVANALGHNLNVSAPSTSNVGPAQGVNIGLGVNPGGDPATGQHMSYAAPSHHPSGGGEYAMPSNDPNVHQYIDHSAAYGVDQRYHQQQQSQQQHPQMHQQMHHHQAYNLDPSTYQSSLDVLSQLAGTQ